MQWNLGTAILLIVLVVFALIGLVAVLNGHALN